MTPIERQLGRFMRAPDGHDGGDAGGEGGDSDASGQGSEGQEGQGSDKGDSGDTLLGGAADTGAGGGDQDGDGKVSDADGGEGQGGDQGKDGDGKDSKSDDAETVPEAYQLDPIKLGDGDDASTVEIDTKLLTEVTPLLKDAGITQTAANKLAPAVIKIQEQVLASLNDDFTATRAAWEKQAREDKDIGGAKLEETLSLAARALDTFGAKSVKDKDGNETNEFRVLLNDTGLGQHPVMLKMFREIGKLVGEDGELIRPDTAPAGKVDRLEVLYPDDVPNKK